MSGTALDPTKVLVGTADGPGLYLAPLGTTLPDDAKSPLDAAFYNVGYVSDEGATLSTETSTTDLFVWQSITPIRSLMTQRAISLGFTMVETSPETLAVYFDTDQPAVSGDEFSINIPDQPKAKRYAAVLAIADGDVRVRFVFESVSLSEAGDIEVTREGLVGYPVTLKVGASLNNDVHVSGSAPTAPIVATGATAGTPGTFTPAGAQAPANLAAMTGLTASPSTAWTTGEHVVLGDNSQAHWDGAAWAADAAA